MKPADRRSLISPEQTAAAEAHRGQQANHSTNRRGPKPWRVNHYSVSYRRVSRAVTQRRLTEPEAPGPSRNEFPGNLRAVRSLGINFQKDLAGLTYRPLARPEPTNLNVQKDAITATGKI